jgi:hypothetical protein
MRMFVVLYFGWLADVVEYVLTGLTQIDSIIHVSKFRKKLGPKFCPARILESCWAILKFGTGGTYCTVGRKEDTGWLSAALNLRGNKMLRRLYGQ